MYVKVFLLIHSSAYPIEWMRYALKISQWKEIQIGCWTFVPTLIKWKHKKRMHFEIETMMKSTYISNPINCCQFSESRGFYFIWNNLFIIDRLNGDILFQGLLPNFWQEGKKHFSWEYLSDEYKPIEINVDWSAFLH